MSLSQDDKLILIKYECDAIKWFFYYQKWMLWNKMQYAKFFYESECNVMPCRYFCYRLRGLTRPIHDLLMMGKFSMPFN